MPAARACSALCTPSTVAVLLGLLLEVGRCFRGSSSSWAATLHSRFQMSMTLSLQASRHPEPDCCTQGALPAHLKVSVIAGVFRQVGCVLSMDEQASRGIVAGGLGGGGTGY